MSKDWASSGLEPSTPVPSLTKCIAIKHFKGEQGNDLPFSRGEVLTIIEPCNVMYWYLAENSVGRRGVIPITHVKVHQVSYKKLPAIPPPSVSSPSSSPPPMDSLSLRETLFPPPLPPLPPKPVPGDLWIPDKSSLQKYLIQPRLSSPAILLHDKKIVGTHSYETASQTHSKYSPAPTREKSVDYPGIPSHSSVGGGTSPESSHSSSPPPLPPLHPRSGASLRPFRQPHTNAMGNGSRSPLSPSTSPSTSPTRQLSSHNSPPRTQRPREYSPSRLPPLQNPWSKPHLPLPSPTQVSKPLSPPSPEGNVSAVQPRQMLPLPYSHMSGPAVDIDNRPPAIIPIEVCAVNYCHKSKPLREPADHYLVGSNPPPNVPRLQPQYENQQAFLLQSGWFSPNLETVLCKMMYSGNITALTSTTIGIYMFTHKHLQTKKYVAKSRTAYHDLVQMFHRLYEKKEDKLNALEREIKYSSPNASQWVFRIYSVSDPEMLEVEANRRIILNNTLQPAGLNKEVMFSSKESFRNFAKVYAQMQRETASKFVNPIRAGLLE